MPRRAIALVLLGAAALAGAASGRPATTGGAALLGRYEPVVELYRADWKPTAVEPFLAAADLERLASGRWQVVRHSPPASALAGGSSNLRLDTRGCTPAVDLDSCYVRTAPLCGNSIGQDKRFLAKYMPRLDDFLHYRIIDVSSIKVLVAEWYAGQYAMPKKAETHRALTDIEESIDELRFYRNTVFIKR